MNISKLTKASRAHPAGQAAPQGFFTDWAWALVFVTGMSLLDPGLAVAAEGPATPVAASPALYQNLGEQAGIARLMDDFVGRVIRDGRIGAHFKNANADNLKKRLTEQVCQVSGGPCRYEGVDMKTAHQDMDISRADFNALVEVLEASMNAQGIAFSQQRRLLALLAPLHRVIVHVGDQ